MASFCNKLHFYKSKKVSQAENLFPEQVDYCCLTCDVMYFPTRTELRRHIPQASKLQSPPPKSQPFNTQAQYLRINQTVVHDVMLLLVKVLMVIQVSPQYCHMWATCFFFRLPVWWRNLSCVCCRVPRGGGGALHTGYV